MALKLKTTDLEHIGNNVSGLIDCLHDSKIFVTGGTGFIGKWMLESFVYLNRKYSLNASMIVLTRNYDLFKDHYYKLAKADELKFITGDICSFDFPEGKIDYIIHAATDTSAVLNIDDPIVISDSICLGTRRVLDLAKIKEVKKILFLSSGAVYGEQPEQLDKIPEDYYGGPDQIRPNAAYAESKRMAEFFCSVYSRNFDIKVSIARCFAFIGPYLNLNANYAVGNFIRNAIRGENIVIHGNGMPRRSYMYAADLSVWLWTILLMDHKFGVYNVGSDKSVSILELANLISEFVPGIKVEVLNQTRPTDRNFNYIPSIDKAIAEFGFKAGISLKESVRRTLEFNLTNI